MNKIIIADASRVNREILKTIFEAEYEILEADTGESVLYFIEKNEGQISLLLLDLMLQKENGIEILAYMDSKGYMKNIPVIGLSEETEAERELRAYQQGVSEIIRKPFSVKIVENRVHNIIELYESRIKMEKELEIRTEQLRREEKASNEANIKLLLSQIRPHFLHNALANIRYLCDLDPELAGNALDHFARYLRENFEALNTNNMVSIRKEIEHANNYLYIEKLRFGDRLSVSWELEEENVLLPVMTLQPLIENTVRNGICQRMDGGVLTIRSYSEGSHVIIEIMGDGADCDVKEISDDDVILKNVKLRIEKLCGGTLSWTMKDSSMLTWIRIPR